MPTVPRLQQQVEQSIGPEIRFNPEAPIAAFGGGETQQAVFSAASNLAQQAKKQADQLELMRVDGELANAEQDLLYGENGIFNKRGKDAFESASKVNDEYLKRSKQIEDSLSTNEQKFLFRQRMQERSQDVNRQMSRHISVQMKEYDDNQTKSYLETEMSAAIKAYHDPERVASSILRQRTAIGLYGERNGLPPEMVKAKQDAAESGTHKQIIARMLSVGDDITAQNYLNSNKDFLKGDDLADAESQVQAGVLRGESQRLAKDIVGKGLGMTQAIAEAKNKLEGKDPKLYDATIDRIKMEFSIKESARRYDQERTQVGLLNRIDKGESFDQIMADPSWAKFDKASRSELMAYARTKAEGKTVETDWQSYYDLRTLAENPSTKEKFLETNLLEYRASLSDSEFKEMIKLQSGLRKGDSKANDQLDGYRTNTQIVSDALTAAGIKNKEKSALFRQAVDREVKNLQEKTGKKVTNDELQSITDNLLTKVVVDKGIIFDTTKSVFELDNQEILDVNLDEIPKNERVKIEDALRRRGIEPNEQAIIELFTKKLKTKSTVSAR